MTRVKRWTRCAVLAPLLLLVGSCVPTAVLNEVANPSSALDVTANLTLVMIFGAFFYLPALVATWLSVEAITAIPLAGRIIATTGLLWTSVVWAVAIADTARLTFDPQRYDEYSWTATLTTVELLIFAAPFAAMLLVNACTTWVLWWPSRKPRSERAAQPGSSEVDPDVGSDIGAGRRRA
ncbi:hypothetical protein MHN80_21660 [Gordonia McavH-238-E]|uniref:hypothetical protein n=1 Tax=Gordonia TaxID=2053 RepID=UPI0015DF2B6D|nr:MULTISPECIES: hypothetical protein [Gordonia]MCG7634926.1 hypothetical protein [Gordonia sp. McavH-238-E]UPW09278.1 hypothetical protein M1C59_25235 [Gordonia terrae]